MYGAQGSGRENQAQISPPEIQFAPSYPHRIRLERDSKPIQSVYLEAREFHQIDSVAQEAQKVVPQFCLVPFDLPTQQFPLQGRLNEPLQRINTLHSSMGLVH